MCIIVQLLRNGLYFALGSIKWIFRVSVLEHFVIFQIHYFPENSLSQTRDLRIRAACSDLDLLIVDQGPSTVDILSDVTLSMLNDETSKKKKAAIEATINVILTVKKIKRDLHIQ